MAHLRSNVGNVERRKHWRDRRRGDERRSSARNQHDFYDCRSGDSRRLSDVTGDLLDGEVWWNQSVPMV